MKKKLVYLFVIFCLMLVHSCGKKEGCTNPLANNYDPEAKADDGSCLYGDESNNPTPATIDIPAIFSQLLPPPQIPSDNPLTVQGISLGKKLFYDPILSGDGTQACASCHAPELSFSDDVALSLGIDGFQGNRNAMPLFNLAWNYSDKFFWDGRSLTLENQAFAPVVDPIEMHNTWQNAVSQLQNSSTYPNLFSSAFGTTVIDSTLVAKALAQFERTLVTGNSKFDKFVLGQVALTPSELNGLNLFLTEDGDCFHCHGSPSNPLWTDNEFRNNGLDATFSDLGLGAVTGNTADNGKFRTPSLRNLVFTAPYMHDGRFATLDEVIDHYSSGVITSATIDPNMQFAGQGGVQLTPTEKADLKAFLLTLTDSSFVTNPAFQE